MWNDTQEPLTRQSLQESLLTAFSRPEPAGETPQVAVPETHAEAGANLSPIERAFLEASSDFLTELEKLRDPVLAAALADRWAEDARPWARMQLLAYLDGPLRHSGHQPLVKRLYRAAERRGDLELVGAFLVAFDRLVTHARRPAPGGDIRLSALQNVIPSFRRRKSDDTWHDHRSKVPLPHRGRLFSYRTRYYLRRRAWRAIRRFAHLEPERYPDIAASLLARYSDDDLATGEAVLDRWGLLQIGYRHHPALAFGRHTVKLRPGRRIASLTPAPSYRSLWQMPTASDALLRLMVEGRSHLVRRWAHQLLLAEHAARLRTLSPLCWLPLLDHARPEIAAFAFEGLQASTTLDRLPIDECLPLLQTRHRAARQFVRQSVIDRVNRGELALSDLATLCILNNRELVGAAWTRLQASTAQAPAAFNRSLAIRLTNVRCHHYAAPIAAWALSLLAEHREETGESNETTVAAVMAFLDHPLPQVRKIACQWWTARKPHDAEPDLWVKLCANRHADVQQALVAWLGRHTGDSLLGKARLLPTAILEHAWSLWEVVLANEGAAVRSLQQAMDQAASAVMQALAAGNAENQAEEATTDPVKRLIGLLANRAHDGRESVATVAIAALVRIAQAGEAGRRLVAQALPALQWEDA